MSDSVAPSERWIDFFGMKKLSVISIHGISAPDSVKSCSGWAVLFRVLVMRWFIVLDTVLCIFRRAVLALGFKIGYD